MPGAEAGAAGGEAAAVMAIIDILARLGQGIAAQADTPYDEQLAEFKDMLEQRRADLEAKPGMSASEAAYHRGKLLDPVMAAIEENQSKQEAVLAAVGATSGADLEQSRDAKAEFINEAVSKAAEQLQKMDIDFTQKDIDEAFRLHQEAMGVNQAQEQRKQARSDALWSAITGAANTGAALAGTPEDINSLRSRGPTDNRPVPDKMGDMEASVGAAIEAQARQQSEDVSRQYGTSTADSTKQEITQAATGSSGEDDEVIARLLKLLEEEGMA